MSTNAAYFRFDLPETPENSSIIDANGNLVVAGEYDGWMVPFACAGDNATANAHLVLEAFNVAHDTGLTPRQLAEQRAELLTALRELSGIIISLRADNKFRLLSNERTNMLSAWLLASEKAIAKATGGAK